MVMMLSSSSTFSLLHPNPLLPFHYSLSFSSKNLTFSHIKPSSLTLSASSIDSPLVAQPQQDESLLNESESIPQLGVVVKPNDKPRLVLKFIWMEKNIGIALDQMIPGHGTIPLSPYYFWPRKDAWEELRELLESKPWISQKQMIILLNQATDIINLWQQSGGNLV
ncbi:PREDICTED: 30S ribosomal protein 3, chloroplastic-like isoform X2 [Lupinus angustifolius]|uniref:30S ribosomal protein 3, chloroplastic-like isoform X2 n=1 Tax=Lupinus angustifolius TaxID=3871 RepID=UPI00092E332A|nr:PREDICTED: 30S ribosomal protein 3, chloroplastic-like isoform X2 [Lupinus angustifolius]